MNADPLARGSDARAVAGLAAFTHVPSVLVAVQVIAQVSVPVSFFLAARRVYGGSVAGTLVKELGVGVIYAFAGTAAILVLAYWAAVARQRRRRERLDTLLLEQRQELLRLRELEQP